MNDFVAKYVFRKEIMSERNLQFVCNILRKTEAFMNPFV